MVAGVGALATGLAVWGSVVPAGAASGAGAQADKADKAQQSKPAAKAKPADRTKPAELAEGRFTKAPAGSKITHEPLALSNAKVTVVVQLDSAPVTVAEAAAEKPLTRSERAAHRKQLRKEQQPVEARIEALGGTVLGDYQSAYNGLKVRIAQKHVPKLDDLPNVKSVHRVLPVTISNERGNPLVGGPAAWQGAGSTPGLTGKNVKIAILDTGIDYTHAAFGGPGTKAAYEQAHAAETEPPDPAWFGPAAPKVKGGIDLVGDSYNADSNSPDYQPVPHPDPNPLDCDGHGTHVAGTAAGFGVTADGETYTGPYGAGTVAANDWKVAPGVAPEAELYAVRVFGCNGPTDVVLDAIEWSVENGMDVINMSLGSPFGAPDAPDAVAADNAAKAGVIVVAASGNDGAAGSPYMSGSPASGTNVISVAANDPTESFPGARLELSTGATLEAVNANGADLPDGELPVKVLMNGGAISLGCDPQEYLDAGVEGALVVVQRGTCARVARAIFGQQAGAAAVVMVNNADTLPPYEGPITSNPDDGTPYDVTIPFLGVAAGDAAALVAADGGTVSLSAIDLDNPSYLGMASFSSAGPRGGDSWLKPDVTAPGVSIFSAGVGTGNDFAVISGTSMATPFAAGVAALVRQAHPTWKNVSDLKAAIVNTADESKVTGWTARAAGSGVVQAPGATRTQVVAHGDKGTATLNFGYAELDKDFVKSKTITVRNHGRTAVTFTAKVTGAQGSPHVVTLDKSTVRVPAGGRTTLRARLAVPASTAGTSEDFTDVAGLVTLTPTAGTNAGVALQVPYYLVPQATSKVKTKLNTRDLVKHGADTAVTTNKKGAVTGTADWYAWGLEDRQEADNPFNDVKAVGVQAFPGVVAFGISTHKRWSTAATTEWDVYVDADRDGTDDYLVVGVDLGLLTAGSADGQLATAVFDLASGEGTLEFLAIAPFNSSTLILPVLIDQLCTTPTACVSEDNPRFDYSVVTYGLVDDSMDVVDGTATFNAFSPALSTGAYYEIAPNTTVTESVAFDAAEFAESPALGFLVMTPDNKSKEETQLIKVKVPGPKPGPKPGPGPKPAPGPGPGPQD